MPTKVTLELSEEEAEWLAACLGLVMQLSRHWDNLSRSKRISVVGAYEVENVTDLSNRILAKLTLARVQGNVGMDPDEWLAQAQDRLGNAKK